MEQCSNKSPLTLDERISFEHLKDAIQSLGPLVMHSETNPYKVIIDVVPCMCGNEECHADIVVVKRENGLFSIRWILEPEQLIEFDSLIHFKNWVILGGLEDSFAERLIIETESELVFDCHYSDVPAITCVCSDCAKNLGEENIWRRMLLSQLSLSLYDRDNLMEYAASNYGDDVEDLVKRVFDLGYTAGRVFSEYAVKKFIEPQALAGQRYEAQKAKRANAAGEKSATLRLKRIEALLSEMERLVADSPNIARIGPEYLAKLACEDAIKRNSKLWSQGAGQIGEYLGLIRRGEVGGDLQERYKTMFP